MSEPTSRVLGGGEASLIQARWSARRMLRGRTVWVAWIFGLLPLGLVMLLAQGNKPAAWSGVYFLMTLVAGVLAPLFMASSMAEEIEDRTFTYLWSRPLPRWSVMIGKLLASVPIVMMVLSVSIVVCYVFARDDKTVTDLVRGLGAAGAGALALCMVSAGFSVLMPRAGMVVTYAYLLMFDLPVGGLPFSLRNVSVLHQMRQLAGTGGSEDPLWGAVVWMFGVGGLWLAIGLWRLSRAEFSAGDK